MWGLGWGVARTLGGVSTGMEREGGAADNGSV